MALRAGWDQHVGERMCVLRCLGFVFFATFGSCVVVDFALGLFFFSFSFSFSFSSFVIICCRPSFAQTIVVSPLALGVLFQPHGVKAALQRVDGAECERCTVLLHSGANAVSTGPGS